MNVKDLLAELSALSKTASAPEEAKATVAPVTSASAPVDAGHEKLAADLIAAGALFGEGFSQRVIEKLANVAPGGAGIAESSKSKWKKVTDAIAQQKGQNQAAPTVSGHATAESVGALHGTGLNTAKATS